LLGVTSITFLITEATRMKLLPPCFMTRRKTRAAERRLDPQLFRRRGGGHRRSLDRSRDRESLL
jgi:hypothetical protein